MLTQTIDTRHGTANQHSFSNGNCLPYTGVPFGMNYFAAQTTDQKGSWWFHPEDRIFQGYRITHQPSPWMGDFSYLTLTPVSGNITETSLFHTQSGYRPEDSEFRPTHLSINQLRYQIQSKLVPSMYGGIMDIDYQQTNNGFLVTLPGRYSYKALDEHTLALEIINFADCEDPDFTFYVVLSFDSAFELAEKNGSGEHGAILLSFHTQKQIVRMGTSFISPAQALLNLEREKTQTYDDYLENSRQLWHELLTRIEIEHHDQEQIATFYHNFYRLFLFPQTFYERDENDQAIHYDTLNKKVRPGVLYTNNGFWDTYKTVYPLFSLIAQDKYEEMLEGFLNSYHETGFLPKWLSPDERNLMPGTLIDAVIADAAVKNIRPDLMPPFLEAMKTAATTQSEDPNYGRQGTLDYLKYGYVPSNYHESVNHTLDYAYSDFCISQVAKTLGKDDDQAYYSKQALNYRSIFNPEFGFMVAKDKDGQFINDFLDIRWGRDYAEGSAWQSSFAVYQDFRGLIQQFGGANAFESKLIELCNQKPIFDVGGYGFEIHEMTEMAAVEFGQLAISNQPSFHYPFLFSYIGKPEMAQPLLKQLMTQTFHASTMGYPGDEDNGSMSGWYLFNSLGFYPVTPGTEEYVLGIPLFDKAALHLSNGETLTLTSSPNHPQQQFVEQIYRNEEAYTKLFLKHSDIMKGGTLHFDLGIVPHPRTYAKEDYPFSLSN
ncbi:GH92 family glycosyl hydrolase [Gracilibacillus phocaeensis]|uniref:GH92 family glycosyl hydrolase n=1 Tax=Gracilibacillus phocaeensis TaxID=2042304 RepID=UPI001031E80F|nr:GH92 family glycosyl hydrolase [Gracilibacillus phocaeensis]